MNSISIDITENVSSALKNLSATLQGESVKAAAGGSAKRIFAQHLAQLDESRANKEGWPRQHFFAKAARSVEYQAEADGVTVSIHQTGIAQRFFGGEIKPVNGRALTIPATAEAYGKRAGEFNNLELIWPRKSSVGMLVERQSDSIRIGKDRRKGHSGETRLSRGKQRGGKVFFWLVSSVTQEPDSSVLPSNELVTDAIVLGILEQIKKDHTS